MGEKGFGPAYRVVQALDEEKGPHLIFADGTESIYLADMSGDGLTDLVRIRNGEVCYWPNLGYCRFGAKVTMDLPSSSDLPYFDNPDQFDNKRIRLADIDGSGTTDIIYLHRDGVRLYFNQSGNSWSAPNPLNVFPRVDDIVSIIPIDLLGNGTACLVWSSPLPSDACKPMRYVNLMGGHKPDLEAQQQDREVQKPHLLELVKNNLGAETRVYYAPSTKFYLQDKRDGKPWITRLPFPVHVVERVETYDRISRNRFVSRYAYHHGYFDGEEREFRGFGMVEQWDTEEIGTVPEEQNSSLATNLGSASFVPPIHSKTWFHTGAYQEAGKISQHLAHEYYGAPKKTDADYDKKWKSFESTLLPDTIPLPELTPSEEREACRALKGSMLRQETYSDDAPLGAPQEIVERANTPYAVTEQNFTIETVQKQGSNCHAVFFIHSREALSYHYERNPDDPRIGHAMTLEVDKYGNVLKSVAIGYGRKQSPLAEQSDRDKQTRTLITYTENSVTNAIDDITIDDITNHDDYRTPLPSETRIYELHSDPSTNGYKPSGVNGFFQCKDFVEKVDGKLHLISSGKYEVDYELILTQDKTRRLIEDVRTLYRKDDLTGLLDFGKLEPLALPGESYKLAFTPGLVKEVYGGRVTDAMLETEGRYVHSEGDKNWWIPSGKVFYSPKEDDTPDDELTTAHKHFFLPRRFCDPFGNSTIVNYDSNEKDSSKNYDLLLIETYDALANHVTAENDYRVLQLKVITDPNGNRSKVLFDALGMMVGTAVMGKESGLVEGDSFATFTADLTPQEIKDYFDAADPRPLAISHLGTATTRIIYDLDRVPACAATIARETHVSDLNGQQTKVQLSFSYSDGFGREIQKKIQAEPVLVNGKKGDPRWVGSGWTIFNNKGKPVRQYEPFFTDKHRFEFDVCIGVSPVLFYDPVERVVATLHPNNTYEKVVFDPWQQKTWDVNDTVMSDPRADEDVKGYVTGYFATQPSTWQTWYQQRIGLSQGDSERDAAEKTAVHNDTPSIAYFDSLGRTFLTIVQNKFIRVENSTTVPFDEKYDTRVVFDIEGNQRAVIDALNRIVMRYDYDMLGNRIKQDSMDAGIRWMLGNVTGNPIYGWDSRGHTIHHVYDQLRRPTHLFVQLESNPEELAERTIYGEIHPDSNPPSTGTPAPLALNLRGKVFLQLDGAGMIINCAKKPKSDTDPNAEKFKAYDFKGNLLRSIRRIAKEYHKCPNWKDVEDKLNKYIKDQHDKTVLETDTLKAFLSDLNSLQEQAEFTSSTTYDALNRPVTLTTPDNSIISPIYNEANLLESLSANLRGEDSRQFIKNIDYNAKGQRELIEYGNDVITEYEYDPQTFRLINLFTTRGTQFPTDCSSKQPCSNPPKNCSKPRKLVCGVQNLHYTYDPSGNITHIRDDAQQPIYFSNSIMQPESDYIYDAIYRLIQAKGREHIGSAETPWPTWDDRGRTSLQQPGNPQQMRNYTEKYYYDEVGNFEWIKHLASNGNGTNQNNWTRSFTIDPDQSDPTKKKSNQLVSCTVGDQTKNFTYDVHGNMTFMPHLPKMTWDFKDQLQSVDKNKEDGECTGCKVYFTYDASGQRVRKVMEQNNKPLNERMYVGGYEIYRKYKSNDNDPTFTSILERESLHIMDDKQRIALVDTKTIDTDIPPKKLPETLIRYQFGNHLGSASLELDENADVISYEEYYPYGSTSYQAVRSKNPGSVEVSTKRYRYTGKERDEETGLYYHGARYYAPWLGRWVSCDPMTRNNGNSPFVYGYLCPLRYTDPDGKEEKESPPENQENEDVDWLTKLSIYFGIKQAKEKLENAANASDEDIARELNEGRRALGAATEKAGIFLGESGDVAMMAIPTPGGGASAEGKSFTKLAENEVVEGEKILLKERPLKKVPLEDISGGKTVITEGLTRSGNIRGTVVKTENSIVTTVKRLFNREQALLKELRELRAGPALKELAAAGEGGKTLALLDIGGKKFTGWSFLGTQELHNVNAIFKTHAEGDVFEQAIRAEVNSREATLVIDHPGGLCPACIAAIPEAARQAGIEFLKVVTPDFNYEFAIPLLAQ